MATLIFLGAGASRAFNIPTMTEMVSGFEKFLEHERIPEKYLYSRIKQTLEKGINKSQIDIESVFSVIQGISEQVTPQSMGSYPYFYIKRFSSEQKFPETEVKEAKTLKELLEKFIQNECKVDPENENMDEFYKNSYDAFFNNLQGVSWNDSDGIRFPIGWKAYTTNYDLVFEHYWADLHPITDFFTYQDTPHGIFSPQKDVQNSWETFVKLHGSLDWEILEDKKIIKSGTFTRKKKKGKAMLYPIQQKDLYLNPWLTLFQEFKVGLQKCDFWYVIGYAFNDIFIREIFQELLSKDKKMMIINPNAKKLRELFDKNAQKQIIPISMKFGSKYFAEDFNDFSENKRTVEVTISSSAKFFGFIIPGGIKSIDKTKEKNMISDGTFLTNVSGGTLVEFHSDDFNPSEVIFEIKINSFNQFQKNIEFKTMTNANMPISVTLKNQGRMIDTFTSTQYEVDNDLGMGHPSSNHCISIERFWP